MKKIALLGSTGSIGVNTLKIVERFPDKFKIVSLSAYNNVSLLAKQIKRFSPKYVAIESEKICFLKKLLGSKKVKIFDVDSEIGKLVTSKDVDIVVLGIEGSAALAPFLEAVRCGKTIAPANKEALVMAGKLIMKEAKRHKATIIPVDSEQSAIFQCLQTQNKDELKKIHLTASGGSLRDVDSRSFDRLPVKDILNHPRWKMGRKITVDSATLMNKGLEVIEAMWLFDVKAKDIDVVIHPESIIHSMVEFCDGSVIAQLGVTDMRIPIQYALTYPKRLSTGLPRIDFLKQGKLTFRMPNLKKFPSLRLCYDVARKSGNYGSVLNAANEEAVRAFLNKKIKFSKMYDVVEKVVLKYRPGKFMSLKTVLEADSWAREQARGIIY